MLPTLTFTPLSRNRYRLNDGLAKPTIIKKARLESFRRDFYGRLRPKQPKPQKKQEVRLAEVRTFVGYADCPSCRHMNYVGNGGITMNCLRCNTRFRALRELNW